MFGLRFDNSSPKKVEQFESDKTLDALNEALVNIEAVKVTIDTAFTDMKLTTKHIVVMRKIRTIANLIK